MKRYSSSPQSRYTYKIPTFKKFLAMANDEHDICNLFQISLIKIMISFFIAVSLTMADG